jgi:hypothetical protein
MIVTGTGAGVDVLSDYVGGKEVVIGIRSRETKQTIEVTDPLALAEVLVSVMKRGK